MASQGVVFLHFPKTGGTTYGAFLKQHLASVTQFESWREVGSGKLEVPDGLLRGHMLFEQVRHLQKKCLFVTIMRHPLERTISYYHHMLRYPAHPHHETAMSISLDEFLYQGNAASEYLTLLDRVPDWNANPPRARPSENQRISLQRALLRLERFDSIGSADDMERSIDNLAQLLRVDAPPKVEHLNKGEHRMDKLDISPTAISSFEEHAKADLAIYDRAMELRERQAV